MKLVDTHVHLDEDAFSADLGAVLEASRSRGISHWINVGYNRKRWVTTTELARETNGMHCMLGLHPGSADEWSEETRQGLEVAIEAAKPVAIGEIGVDRHWRQDNIDWQKMVFAAQLELAVGFALPAVIHMREADKDVLDVLHSTAHLPHVHFHSFDGDEALRAWALENNATIGVGGLITRVGSESLRDWVTNLPKDRIVLETDAPWLKPRGIRGRRNEPAYLVKVAEVLAGLWDIDVDAVARITTTNAERIFGMQEG